MLEAGSTITPSYYGSPTGPTEPLTGTFSWTYVAYDAYWTTVNFNTTALNFHSPSYTLTLASPDSDGTSTSGPWAAFEANVNAGRRGRCLRRYIFVPWPANDGTFEGDPFMPSRLIFLHERLDPGPRGPDQAFTRRLVPEPSAAALILLGLLSW